MLLRVIDKHCLGVKFVSFITRVDVNVKVPDVLVARRLIVLTCRNTIAPVRRFHCDCRLSKRPLNRSAQYVRSFIDVFVVLNWNDESRTRIGWPPPRVHLYHDVVVAMENLNGEGSSASHDVLAEWAVAPLGLVAPTRSIHGVVLGRQISPWTYWSQNRSFRRVC